MAYYDRRSSSIARSSRNSTQMRQNIVESETWKNNCVCCNQSEINWLRPLKYYPHHRFGCTTIYLSFPRANLQELGLCLSDTGRSWHRAKVKPVNFVSVLTKSDTDERKMHKLQRGSLNHDLPDGMVIRTFSFRLNDVWLQSVQNQHNFRIVSICHRVWETETTEFPVWREETRDGTAEQNGGWRWPPWWPGRSVHFILDTANKTIHPGFGLCWNVFTEYRATFGSLRVVGVVHVQREGIDANVRVSWPS